jgi:XapX domain-containing protein
MVATVVVLAEVTLGSNKVMRAIRFKAFGDPSVLELAEVAALVSLLMELVVDAAYGFVQVRSPAPPMIALIGLFGMLLGQQAVDMAKRHLAPSARTSIQQKVGGVQGSS